MATITEIFGSGGSGLTPKGSGSPTLAEGLRDVADDLTELRAKFIALCAKLDDDGGVTDQDYESGLTPDAMLTIKG